MKQSIILLLFTVLFCMVPTEALSQKRAYVVLNYYASGNTRTRDLTFYYDEENRANSNPLNEGYEEPVWSTNIGNAIIQAKIDDSFIDARPTSCYKWFFHTDKNGVQGINFLNTSEVTNMAMMFSYSNINKTLDLSYFDTSKVTDMNSMFYSCRSTETINVSSFNTSNVTDMSKMFASCLLLKELDLSHFNTSRVNNMEGMFESCRELVNLDVSHFNTTRVNSMKSMFDNNWKLSTLDVSNFNTSNVRNMSGMFLNCKSLTCLDFSNFNTLNVQSMYDMFHGCSSLTSLDLSSFNTSNVTDMRNMFWGCSNMTSLNLSSFDLSNVGSNTSNMFLSCNSLKKLRVSLSMSKLASDACSSIGTAKSPCLLIVPEGFDFGGIDTSGAYFKWKGGYFYLEPVSAYCHLSPDGTILTFYNDDKKETRDGTTFAINTTTTPEWSNSIESVSTVVFDSSFSEARPASTFEWFNNMNQLSNIEGLEYLNTSSTTDVSRLFGECYSIEELDLSSFEMNNVSNSTQMLHNCTNLKKLTVSASMNGIAEDACEGIGTMENPCLLIAPDDFDFGGTDTSGDYFLWKSGYFTLKTWDYVNMSQTYGDEFSLHGTNMFTLPLIYEGNIIYLTSNDMVTNGNGITYIEQGDPYGDVMRLQDQSFVYTAGTGTFTVTGTAGNHIIEYTLTVNKAPVTVTAKSYTIVQGESMPAFEANYEGFKAGQTSSVLTTQPSFSCSASSSDTPGTYDIVVSGAEAKNYTFTYVNGTLTVVEPWDYITITSSGVGTYCSNKDLDFSNVTDFTAYVALGYNTATTTVTVVKVTDVPAGTGLYLQGKPGTYPVPWGKSYSYYVNLLKGTTSDIILEPTEGDCTNYILYKDSNSGIVGFRPLMNATNMPKNKAYLQIPTNIVSGNGSGNTKEISIWIDNPDEEGITTGISNIENDMADDAFYTLSGIRVEHPQKGIYIHRGKKVVVK